MKSRTGISIDALDPQYSITVNDTVLGPDITRFITSVEYEDADGMPGKGVIKLENPGGILTGNKLLQPLNEINIAFGYGLIEHVGRIVLVRPRFNFPSDDTPSIELIGYTADQLMATGQKVKGREKKKKGSKKTKKPSRQWSDLHDLLNEKAGLYEMELDAPDRVNLDHAIVQKTDMSDYDLLKAVSNLLGWYFWVDGASDGTWTLHFRAPTPSGILASLQEKKYMFQYAIGGSGTLLSFEPEYSVHDAKVKLRVESRNPIDGKTFEAEFEDDLDCPDLRFVGDPGDKIEGVIATGGSARLYWGEFSIETITNRRFRSNKEVEIWAAQWFRRNRENFIVGNGVAIGIEKLMARQVHRIEGCGKSFDGDYYFARVAHKLDGENGYTCDFSARRVFEQ